MKITERKLLSGLDGITNGRDLISIVDGREIRWNYRTANDDGRGYCVTDTRERADIISLECDRHGHIPLLKRLSPNDQERVNEVERLYRTVGGDEV